MRRLGLALAATASIAAGPVGAETGAPSFEPVTPEGLDAKAGQMVAALQASMPGQMAAFAAQGFGAYGALAVPVGVALTPQSLASAANLDSIEAAKAKTLEVCKAQNNAACTVIGLILPAGN